MGKILTVRLKADYGIFTDPLTKTERSSKNFPSPSTVRGILESILWKPEMQYIIHKIVICRDIEKIVISKKEISTKPSSKKLVSSLRDGKEIKPFDRIIRQTEMLKDVIYDIHFEIVIAPHLPNVEINKYETMFNHRLKKGQCKKQPFMGQSDSICEFEPIEEELDPIDLTEDSGMMLIGKKFENGTPIRYIVSEAKIINGTIEVPREPQEEMISCSWKGY